MKPSYVRVFNEGWLCGPYSTEEKVLMLPEGRASEKTLGLQTTPRAFHNHRWNFMIFPDTLCTKHHQVPIYPG